MTFNNLSSPLDYLHTRRSGRPRDMIAPGPDTEQLRELCLLALRSPDHGKLAPTRFVIIEDRAALEALFTSAYLAEKPDASEMEVNTMRAMAQQAPALVVALHSPIRESKIPLWEQQLSTGAACMNFLHALHSSGFVGGWITGWPAFSDTVRDAFGKPHEKIAGFIYAGTPGSKLEERPRPDLDQRITVWPS